MNAADYPFTREAAEEVRKAGYTIEDLLGRRAFLPVRRRAAVRLLGALAEGIPPEYSHSQVELFSYPFARVMVSCLGDDHLIRRYALAEAKLAGRRMAKEGDLLDLARDLGLTPSRAGDLIRLHFSQYLPAASRMHSSKWKLVNRSLKGGFLSVTSGELLRLMEELARDRVQKGLPLPVSPEICAGIEELLHPIRLELQSTLSRDRADLGAVQEGAFPPCIRAMLDQVAAGVNLAHTARFALTSFLLQIGMSVEGVMAVFNTSPDFDCERTRYQVEHIAGSSGTRYKPPSCATMATYGNCPGEDDLCRRVTHPLSYYRKKGRSKINPSPSPSQAEGGPPPRPP
ncbi:MAG: DNA primase large subunit PriL [Methanotrichaceae archaeon]|nr:DNA primase large subunit PriL [Methanotrichaceae archaeon]